MAKQFQVNTASGGSLTTNLVAYYKLEDATEFYVGGGTHDLTNNNSVTFVSGKVNNGGDFERSSSMSLTKATDWGIDGGSISFSCWYKPESAPTGVDGNGHIIMSQAKGTSNQNEYLLEYVNDGGTLKLRGTRLRMGIGVAPRINYAVDLGTSAFSHLVMTYDTGDSTLRLYINGSEVVNGTGSGAGNFDDGTASGIGCQARVPASHADGIIDEAGVWSKALNTDEITDLYNGGSGQTMEEVASTVVKDIIGSGFIPFAR